MITLAQAEALCRTPAGRKAVAKYLPHLNALMPVYGIESPAAVAAFLAQIAHESADFTRVVENLNYSDPVRIASLFRSGFDLDKDRVVDPEEIEFARAYVRQPEKLANRAYANRMGNGDEASGEGWLYRGRGLKQLTGKDNHRACGAAIGQDLVKNPDLLTEPRYAVESACWFWKDHNLTHLAEIGDFELITKRINGALTGHAERMAYLSRIEKVLA